MKNIKSIIATVIRSLRKVGYFVKSRLNSPIKVHIAQSKTMVLLPNGAIPELLYTSRFEKTEINLAADAIKEGMVVVDVGANVGLYSILAEKVMNGNGRIWSIEPSSESFQKFTRNLSLNNCTIVEPVKVALSSQSGGTLVLKRNPGERDGDRYLAPSDLDKSASRGHNGDCGDDETVEVLTLDSFVESRKIHRVDFIKIDIEGGEYDMLLGSRGVLTANAEIALMFECAAEGCARYRHTQREVFDYLASLRFYVRCWDKQAKEWRSDPAALCAAGNLWASREEDFFQKLQLRQRSRA